MKAWRLAVTALLIALAAASALPAGAQGSLHVWVDDDYCPSCPNGGHRWQVDAFSSIAPAMQAVSSGGTVHLLPGRYEESVTVDRPCTLTGHGPGRAVIGPGQGTVTLLVAANDVTIEGVEVAGGEQAALLVLGPDFQRQPIRGVTVRQSTVRGGYFGIAVNIDPQWNYGQLPASEVEITGNSVSGCTRAIYVYNAQAEISANDVAGLAPGGIGIYSSQGSTSRITANTVRVEAANGRAVYVLDNQGTVVDGNTLLGATDVLTPTTAFALYGYTDLVLSNNAVHGFYWGTNAYTGGSARIAGNTFRDAVAWALNLGTAVTTTQVLIQDNVIRGSYWGVRLDDDARYGLTATVDGNTLTDNVVGIRLAASVRKGQVTIRGNAICQNLAAGLRNESAALVDASDNWWGANDGPRLSGSGDRVEGAVAVEPWARLGASARTLLDGRVLITARLGSDRYPLRGRYLSFTTDAGAFLETAGLGHTALTDWRGEATATLRPLQGETARVTVSNGCGAPVTLTAR